MKYAIALLLISTGLDASRTGASEISQEEEGIHIRANDSSESVIAKAARMGASVVISSDEEEGLSETVTMEPKPDVYAVKEGDTLWDISERFFGDAYVWPRIWAYNPGITNPNWIYPGDTLLLGPNSGNNEGTLSSAAVPMGNTRLSSMPNQAVLNLNHGFVDKEALKKAGEIVGSHKEVVMLSQHDEAYVEFPDKSVKVGDRVQAFNVLREVDSIDDPDTNMGKLVEIQGLLRVISFDQKTKIARAVIEEAIVPINRGTLVGEVHQYMKVVPGVKNQKDIKGNIIAFLDLGTLAASYQVVFIDRGAEEGVTVGNRFFAVEQRDGLRRINREPNDREGYPVEVIAEIRVMETRPHTSTCLITSALRELEVGQKVEMRKGY